MGTRAYVTRSLEDALWAVEESTCLEDGALLAVNLGEDADTTGAVYGQLAGAYYGVDSIPERWRSTLAKLDVVESFVSASTKRRSRSRETLTRNSILVFRWTTAKLCWSAGESKTTPQGQLFL